LFITFKSLNTTRYLLGPHSCFLQKEAVTMARLRPDELAQKARFIFRGTIQRRNAATMDSVPVSDRTVVVRVDEILQAPEALAGYLGQEITVQLSGRQKVQEGQQAVFYTNGWLFGDSIAVQSIGHHPVARTRELLLSQPAGPTATPRETLAHRDLQKRVAEAETVVTGKVINVRIPQSSSGGRPATAAATESDAAVEPSGRISEHDPEWREAVIEVEEVEKGRTQTRNVVILFPSSNDVQWYRAPKFEAGQQGVFLLHPRAEQAESRGLEAAALSDSEEEIYVALDPADFQPTQQLPVVKTLIAQAAEPSSPSA
jgi:hypothetical protein